MNYRFSDHLDLAKLQEFYDGDPRLAVGVFDAFVMETVTALPELGNLYTSGDLAEFRRLVHKIKPGFLYVGLTSLYEKLSELEVRCGEVKQTSELSAHYAAVTTRLLVEVPWVENELGKLKELEAMAS
ncbi:MAG: hypothetical protein EOO09_15350 [Chitinophagaceae bacterium]|nr:MAG: hypothetical protein EOO09_15350 [Chitinophagaceae bacterium]